MISVESLCSRNSMLSMVQNLHSRDYVRSFQTVSCADTQAVHSFVSLPTVPGMQPRGRAIGHHPMKWNHSREAVDQKEMDRAPCESQGLRNSRADSSVGPRQRQVRWIDCNADLRKLHVERSSTPSELKVLCRVSYIVWETSK